MKENLRQQFRWAPHLSGVTAVKPKDYEEVFTIDAPTLYAAWNDVRGTGQELMVGDLLGWDDDLRILKYIGFEEARWILPEAPRPAPLPDAAPQQSAALG